MHESTTGITQRQHLACAMSFKLKKQHKSVTSQPLRNIKESVSEIRANDNIKSSKYNREKTSK